MRYLEREEISRLPANASKGLRPILLTEVLTGMRRGEILRLKWHDIDSNKGIIYLLDTKNGDKREVYMCDRLKKVIMAVPKHSDSPYVFTKNDGTPYKDIRKSFFTALKKLGIINFCFHDLRHAYASQLVMSGVDINTTREFLGHKDVRMTLGYSHLSPSHKRKAVEILSKQLDVFWTPEVDNSEIEKLSVS